MLDDELREAGKKQLRLAIDIYASLYESMDYAQKYKYIEVNGKKTTIEEAWEKLLNLES